MKHWLLPAVAAFSLSVNAATITPSSDATALVNAILGTGVTLVGAPTLTGVDNQQGTFTGGVGTVGFPSGIVLSSGDVTMISGPNTTGPETRGAGSTSDDDISTSLGTAGDADLSALAGASTFDANLLTFSFQFGDGSIGGDLFFNFVFASEEYIDFIDSQFNDVFGFFLDGTNIALVGGQPITVNTINDVQNSGSYVNNVTNTNGIPVAGRDIKFDGLTTVLRAQALGLGAGVHTISLRVADTSDSILDAAVFVQAGTFSTTPTPIVPEPSTYALLITGFAALGFLGRRLRQR